MQTMDAALVDLVRRGKISMQIAERRSSTPDEMRRLMGQAGVAPMRMDGPTMMPPAPGGTRVG
jgi:hypothetical protein